MEHKSEKLCQVYWTCLLWAHIVRHKVEIVDKSG
jgi:hypothetical protein